MPETRLLHVTQPTTGGTSRMVVELTKVAVAAGWAVTVASPDDSQFRDQVAAAGADWTELRLTRRPSLRDGQHVRTLRQLYAGVEVVHLHSTKAGALGRLATYHLHRRPRVVFTPHAWSWYAGGRLAPAYQWFERWQARRADVIINVSAQEYAHGIAVLGGDDRLVRIDNGIDPLVYRPDGPRAARSEAALIVLVGRLAEQKGVDRAIRAMPYLRNTTAILRIVGGGPSEHQLRTLVSELGLSRRVELLGETDPRPHLRASDVVVAPSRWEGMSLALLEAMATACAIVATDCGGTDVLAGAGIVVPQDGSEQQVVRRIAQAIDSLLDDQQLRGAWGRRARARVVERYTLDHVAAAHLRIWSDILS